MAFLSGYTKRKKITIDNTKVDSNLTDFPVRVYLNADSDIGAVSNADGFDIRFTSSDGTTLLKYEREDFAISGGKATGNFFVKVPSVSSSADTEIYIYYRADDTADGADPTNVWDSNFKGRYSMKDLTTSTIEDSTSNDNDGTKTGANTPDQVDGKIYKGQDFSGNNERIDVGSALRAVVEGSYTYSVWLKSSSTTTVKRILGVRHTDEGLHLILFNYTSAGVVKYYAGSGSDANALGSVSTGLNDGAFRLYHFVLDGETQYIYINGAQDATRTRVTGTSTSTNFFIGDDGSGTAAQMFEGILDEVRISNVARSAAWIKAEYNSGNNTLLSLGAEEETSEYTATYTPVLLSLVIPAITATAIVAATASFTPVALSQTIPDMTASYEAEYEANYTPLEISQTIPDFTASYIAEIEATYTPLEMSLVIPDMTAIGITKLININKNSGVITAISKNTGNLKNINKS